MRSRRMSTGRWTLSRGPSPRPPPASCVAENPPAYRRVRHHVAPRADALLPREALFTSGFFGCSVVCPAEDPPACLRVRLHVAARRDTLFAPRDALPVGHFRRAPTGPYQAPCHPRRALPPGLHTSPRSPARSTTHPWDMGNSGATRRTVFSLWRGSWCRRTLCSELTATRRLSWPVCLSASSSSAPPLLNSRRGPFATVSSRV